MITQYQIYKLAERLHAGQVDKAGSPYIAHCARVYSKVRDYGGDRISQYAALLHDAMEDCGATEESLQAEGVPPEVTSLVRLLTKPEGEAYFAYLSRIRLDPAALLIKLADIGDNMDPLRLAKLDPAVRANLRAKYNLALDILLAQD